jgi:hypothetical protein
MNAVFPYVVFAFVVIMGGMASASLVQSSEERWMRKGFFYKYGAFLFYAILAVIGVFVLINMYQSGSLTGFVIGTVTGTGLSVVGGKSAAVLARLLTPLGVHEARAEGYLEKLPVAPNEQKNRRQVGHGRYHT